MSGDSSISKSRPHDITNGQVPLNSAGSPEASPKQQNKTPTQLKVAASFRSSVEQLLASPNSPKNLATRRATIGAAQENTKLSPRSIINQTDQLIERAIKGKGSPSVGNIGDKVFSASWSEKRLSVIQSGEILGQGSFGIARRMNTVGSEQLSHVIKYAKPDEDEKDAASEKGIKGIRNEYALLHDIHKNGKVKGIQDPPHAVFPLSMEGAKTEGIITVPYDFDLESPLFTSLPFEEKAVQSAGLLEGLKSIHSMGIVHRDIKPPNCCSKNGELQIADWGDATKIDDVSLSNPLGVHSDFYTASDDHDESMIIKSNYTLHLEAETSGTQEDYDIAKALNYLLLNDRFPVSFTDQDQESAKIYVAYVISEMVKSGMTEKALNEDEIYFENYDDQLKDLNDNTVTAEFPDLSSFYMDDKQIEQHKKDCQALAKRHDVYSMALTILENLSGISKKQMQEYIDNDKETSEIIVDLLDKVRDKSRDIADYLDITLLSTPLKRPTAEQFLQKYQELIKPYVDQQKTS